MLVHAVPRPEWSPLPREGCRGVHGRVLYSEPTLAVAQLRFEPGGTIDEHPADHPVEVLVLSGSGFTSVGDRVAPVRQGERVRWPAGVPHRLWTEDGPMETLMLERLALRRVGTASAEGRELDPLLFGEEQRCFGCGPHNEVGMGLRFAVVGDEVVTRFRARPGWDGPPGIVHGGLQSTLADELGAWTIVGLRNMFGFTATMNLRFYRPARSSLEIEGRGRILSESGALVVTGVTLRQEGKRVLSGKVTFNCPTLAMAEKMLGMTLPPEWKALTRTE